MTLIWPSEKRNGIATVIGGAFALQVAHHRKIELAVRLFEAAAHAARAADDRRERTVGEPRLLQDVVLLVYGADAGRIGAPHEHGGEDLRMQRGQDDGAAIHRKPVRRKCSRNFSASSPLEPACQPSRTSQSARRLP